MEWKCQKNCLECNLPKCVLDIKDEREDLEKMYKKQDSDRHKVYYKRNREAIAEKRKKYYSENKEWIKEKNAKRKALRKELEMANESNNDS